MTHQEHINKNNTMRENTNGNIVDLLLDNSINQFVFSSFKIFQNILCQLNKTTLDLNNNMIFEFKDWEFFPRFCFGLYFSLLLFYGAGVSRNDRLGGNKTRKLAFFLNVWLKRLNGWNQACTYSFEWILIKPKIDNCIALWKMAIC